MNFTAGEFGVDFLPVFGYDILRDLEKRNACEG